MRILLIIASVASLAAIAYVTRAYLRFGEFQVAHHFVERIGTLEDVPAAALVGGLTIDDEQSVRSLVELAASLRERVSAAAKQRLDRWMTATDRRIAAETLDAQTSKLVVAAADELAARADALGPGALAWAASLGRRLVSTADYVPREGRLEFLDDCDQILAAESGRTARRIPGVGVQTRRVAEEGNRTELTTASVDQRLMAFAIQRGPLPSGATLATHSTTSEDNRLAAGPSGPATSGTLHESGADEGANGTAAPKRTTAIGPGLAWRRTAREEPYARIRPSSEGGPSEAASVAGSQTLDVPSPDVTRAREIALQTAPLSEAIAALASQDPFETAAAQAALRARGMSPVDLEIARRLPNSDASARRTLLDQAAAHPGVKLAAWLPYFASDTSADVRLRALGLLATSRDEAVRADVYARAVRDDDPRIRALAERLHETAALAE